MKSASPLTNILKKGLFGDHENKNNLTKIKEETNEANPMAGMMGM